MLSLLQLGTGPHPSTAQGAIRPMVIAVQGSAYALSSSADLPEVLPLSLFGPLEPRKADWISARHVIIDQHFACRGPCGEERGKTSVASARVRGVHTLVWNM